jgi:hypothetical protein
LESEKKMGKKNDDAAKGKSFTDGTVFYTYEEAKEMLRSIEPKKYTLSDTALILLYAQTDKPVFGRILLMKEMFLLINEILGKKEVQDAKYVPYRYGMYSFALGNVLRNLEFAGYIDRTGKPNSKLEHFKLTDRGKSLAKQIWCRLPENTQREIENKRKGWDQLGVEGILRLVYEKYPEYAKDSYVKGRYKAISWGRGIG